MKCVDGKHTPETQADLDQQVIDDAKHQEGVAYLATIQYRINRGHDYAAELGDMPGINNAMGDSLDAMFDAIQAVLDSTATPAPAKFAEKKAKRDEIKARFPKP